MGLQYTGLERRGGIQINPQQQLTVDVARKKALSPWQDLELLRN